jgi:glycogen operon protein
VHEIERQHESHALAFCLRGHSEQDVDLYAMINAGTQDVAFCIQEHARAGWKRVVDTGLDSPDDIAEAGLEQLVREQTYRVNARSVVVLTG